VLLRLGGHASGVAFRRAESRVTPRRTPLSPQKCASVGRGISRLLNKDTSVTSESPSMSAVAVRAASEDSLQAQLSRVRVSRPLSTRTPSMASRQVAQVSVSAQAKCASPSSCRLATKRIPFKLDFTTSNWGEIPRSNIGPPGGEPNA
jgi:hypothetical protein